MVSLSIRSKSNCLPNRSQQGIHNRFLLLWTFLFKRPSSKDINYLSNDTLYGVNSKILITQMKKKIFMYQMFCTTNPSIALLSFWDNKKIKYKIKKLKKNIHLWCSQWQLVKDHSIYSEKKGIKRKSSSMNLICNNSCKWLIDKHFFYNYYKIPAIHDRPCCLSGYRELSILLYCQSIIWLQASFSCHYTYRETVKYVSKALWAPATRNLKKERK